MLYYISKNLHNSLISKKIDGICPKVSQAESIGLFGMMGKFLRVDVKISLSEEISKQSIYSTYSQQITEVQIFSTSCFHPKFLYFIVFCWEIHLGKHLHHR